eukprot:8244692-Lingulodinium_polyedra.AAC.1
MDIYNFNRSRGIFSIVKNSKGAKKHVDEGAMANAGKSVVVVGGHPRRYFMSLGARVRLIKNIPDDAD